MVREHRNINFIAFDAEPDFDAVLGKMRAGADDGTRRPQHDTAMNHGAISTLHCGRSLARPYDDTENGLGLHQNAQGVRKTRLPLRGNPRSGRRSGSGGFWRAAAAARLAGVRVGASCLHVPDMPARWAVEHGAPVEAVRLDRSACGAVRARGPNTCGETTTSPRRLLRGRFLVRCIVLNIPAVYAFSRQPGVIGWVVEIESATTGPPGPNRACLT